MIEIKKLTKIYKINKSEVKVLDNITLSLPNHGLIAILGISGAGKTTLLNIIAGLDNKASGTVSINGKNILCYNEKKLCKYRLRETGYVFQEANLFSFLKVEKNVAIPALIGGLKAKPLELLKRVKMEKYINKKVAHLSGGQKQRVAIARALVNNPSILLCDEPTGALDTQNTVNVMNILKELAKEKLILLVTHNQYIAKQYADRIIKIGDGKILEDEIIHQIVDNKVKKKRRLIKPFKSLSFVFSYALKYLNIKINRTMITAFSAAIGLLGIILSMTLGQGFKGYFESEFRQYQKYDGIYVTQKLNDELMSVKPSDLAILSKSQELNYGYFVTLGGASQINKVSINSYESGMDIMMLGYTLIYDDVDLNYDEIGIIVNDDYMGYLAYILNTQNELETINQKLLNSSFKLIFEYQNEHIYFNKRFNIKKIRLSRDGGVNLFHTKDDFVYHTFEEYPLSWTPLADSEGMNITSYIINPTIEDKNQLALKQEYEYIHDNHIVNNYYVSNVYYATYLRFFPKQIEKIYDEQKMNGYIYCSYGGINLDLSFMEAEFSHGSYKYAGADIMFRPIRQENITGRLPDAYEEIIISRGLANQIGEELTYHNKHYNKTMTLMVVGYIETDEKIIYQNSEWSYLFFTEMFGVEDYQLNGLGGIYFGNDEKHLEELITQLRSEYDDYEFFCPLIEILKNLDQILNVVVLGISGLSLFSIIISTLLIGVITFVNVVEETRHIGLLRIIGLRRSGIVTIFIFESLITGIMAFFITMVFSLLVTQEVNMVFSMLLGTPNQLAVIRVSDLLTTLVILLTISFVSGLFPSIYASSLPPLKAIKQR